MPGTEEERAEARRAKVRANVQAFRRRQKERKCEEEATQDTNDDRIHHPSSGKVVEEQANAPCTLGYPELLSPCLQPASISSHEAEPWLSLWTIPSEFGARLIGTTYQDVLTTALQNNSLPAQTSLDGILCESRKKLEICCSTGIIAAAVETGRPETGALMDALEAASLAIIGRDRRDEKRAIQAALVQTRALRRLREALARYIGGDQTIDPITLSLTALTCAMSELVANQSWDNFNRHLQGVGALIFHSGVEGLQRTPALEHYYGYRVMQVPLLFMTRQTAFLSRPEWIDLPGKEQLELAQLPLHTMLDIALRLLPEVVKQKHPKRWKLTCLKERLRRVWTVVKELDQWERKLRAQHQGALYTKRRAAWGDLYDDCLEFSVLSSGVAFTMYTAVRIHAVGLIAHISADILLREPSANVCPKSAMLEAFRWARRACRCLEFFHTVKAQFAGLIVTLWPLETAWDFFAHVQADGSMDVSRELTWCRSAAERLAQVGIPPFQWR